MKKRNLLFAFILTAGCSIMASEVVAQSESVWTKTENDRIDSLKASHDAEERRSQDIQDKENLSDLKSEKSDTKEKAKEADRIENEASDAARESKIAYRTEKKAQKARKQADKQAKKAAKARTISDGNK